MLEDCSILEVLKPRMHDYQTSDRVDDLELERFQSGYDTRGEILKAIWARMGIL